jgi:hypothetical protein
VKSSQGILGVIAGLSLVASSAAQFAPLESDKAKGDFYFQSFGRAIAIDGDVVAVGSPNENLDKGAVWVYRVSGGELVFEQKLLDPTPVSNDLFGISVSVSGDLIAVGSPGTGNLQFNDDGEMYVFRFDGATWNVEFSVTGQELGYGTAVDVEGDVVAVGFPHADIGAPNSGVLALYRFDGNAWGPNGVLVGTLTNGNLGKRLALGGDWLFAANGLGISVYYVDGGWQFVQTLALSNEALAVDGDVLVVGQTSSATVLRRSCDTWSAETVLSDPLKDISVFGQAVSVDGDAILVGSWNESIDGSVMGGAAFVFRHDGAAWGHEQTLLPTDGHASQQFGWSVGIAGDLCVAGANADDETWPNSGAAYLYEAVPQTPRWQDLGSGLSGVRTPELSGAGTLQAGEQLSLALACAGPGNAVALFVGFSAIDAPFKGGVLVPNPDVLVTGLVVDGQGTATLTAAWPGGVPSGFGLYFQEWITDAGAPAGLAATNALLGTTP